MKSGKCCLLSSLVIIIGLGIGGYIFREKIIHEYNKYWNSYTSSIDEDTATIIYESSEEIEDTTTNKITTTSTLSSTTEEDYQDPYPDPDPEPDLEISEEEEDFSTIVETTEAPTTTSSTTAPPTTTSPTERTSSTTSLFEGSGTSNKILSTRQPDHYDEEYDDEEIAGSGSDA